MLCQYEWMKSTTTKSIVKFNLNLSQRTTLQFTYHTCCLSGLHSFKSLNHTSRKKIREEKKNLNSSGGKKSNQKCTECADLFLRTSCSRINLVGYLEKCPKVTQFCQDHCNIVDGLRSTRIFMYLDPERSTVKFTQWMEGGVPSVHFISQGETIRLAWMSFGLNEFST